MSARIPRRARTAHLARPALAFLLVAGLAAGVAPLGRHPEARTAAPAAPAVSPAEAGLLEAVLEGELPDDAMLFRRMPTGDGPSASAFAKAHRAGERITAETKQAQPVLAKRTWRFTGPDNIGARVVDMVADPRRRNTLYVASASGGVWVSRDAGMTYRPAWGVDMPQTMGALALGPDGTLWAGTGEANPGGGSLTYGGGGVYRSRDRGRTWTNVGLRNSPASAGSPWIRRTPSTSSSRRRATCSRPAATRGLYETPRRRRHVDPALARRHPDHRRGRRGDRPGEPRNVLVAMWDHIRYPDRRVLHRRGLGHLPIHRRRRSFERLGPSTACPRPLPTSGGSGVTFDAAGPEPRLRRSTPTTRSARSRPGSSRSTEAAPGWRRRRPLATWPRRRASTAGGSAGSGSTRRTPCTSS